MDVFGIPVQELIFSVFLPFLLFYILFYALLRKSKVLGDVKSLNASTALVLAGIVISSAYAIGIIQYITSIGVMLAIVAFVAVFWYGTAATAARKLESYRTGEAFKTEDEKKFDKAKDNANTLWERVKKQFPKVDPHDFTQLQEQVKILESLATKLGKDLAVELPWYPEYKEIVKQVVKGG
jgi:hypothetical protein